jgi:catechol 2,3-dioxygenase-like lactoylglutathione lyase family enzyme
VSTTYPEITTAVEGHEVSTVPMKLEVTTIPVADVDRAKEFYLRLGWRFDIDFWLDADRRGVQFTPPGSPASIQFGQGTTTNSEPLQRLLLVVDDIDAAHDELVSRGIDVSDVFHAGLGEAPAPGRDPEGRSYASHATFEDPDGNQWVLQEVTERLPGR